MCIVKKKMEGSNEFIFCVRFGFESTASLEEPCRSLSRFPAGGAIGRQRQDWAKPMKPQVQFTELVIRLRSQGVALARYASLFLS